MSREQEPRRRTIPEVIGAHVREARKKQGFTQEVFGRLVGNILSGKPWTAQVVSQAEKGRRAFTASELVAIAYCLEVPLGWLFQPEKYDEHIYFADGNRMLTGDLFHSIAGSWFQEGEKETRRQHVLRTAEEARWHSQQTEELLEELRLELAKVEEQTLAEEPESVLEQMSPRPVEAVEEATERLGSSEEEGDEQA